MCVLRGRSSEEDFAIAKEEYMLGHVGREKKWTGKRPQCIRRRVDRGRGDIKQRKGCVNSAA